VHLGDPQRLPQVKILFDQLVLLRSQNLVLAALALGLDLRPPVLEPELQREGGYERKTLGIV
jgi:hypothetical protein